MGMASEVQIFDVNALVFDAVHPGRDGSYANEYL